MDEKNTLYGLTIAGAETLKMVFGLPFFLLLLQNDQDSQNIVDFYQQYKRLMFKIAQQYFYDDHHEIEDVISETVIKMIKNFSKIKTLSDRKAASYVVKIVRSVCNDILRKRKQQPFAEYQWNDEIRSDELSNIEESSDMVFSHIYAVDLLYSFRHLSEREKQLIRLRHIDGLSYEDIGFILGINESAARTALSRALSRLETLAKTIDKDEL